MAANDMLTPKQETFLACLLSGHGVTTAAKLANVAERTAFRWLQLPRFQQAYEDAKRKVFDEAMQALCDASAIAVKTLMRNMSSDDTPASVQVNAARITLEGALTARKLKEAHEITHVVGMAIDPELLPYLNQDDIAEIRRRFDLAAQRQQARKAQ